MILTGMAPLLGLQETFEQRPFLTDFGAAFEFQSARGGQELYSPPLEAFNAFDDNSAACGGAIGQKAYFESYFPEGAK